MEAKIKQELGTTVLRLREQCEGGYINEGRSYDTDTGKIFVKINHKSQAKVMFEGEVESLNTIFMTETVKVPRPLQVIELDDGGCVFVTEHLDMKSLKKYSRLLGDQLAELHLHNKRQIEKHKKDLHTVGKGTGQSEVPIVEKHGFHVTTCSGYIPQENEWQEDWVTFYSRQRLQPQFNMLEESYGNREVRELWAELQLKIPRFFKDLEIVPALLHGDLWDGNVAETSEGPVVFDPSSFYGHSEFELGIGGMFGGFSSSFYSAYHKKILKAPGFAKRHLLYRLFNSVNHWNHFGNEYRRSSINLLKRLLK